MTRVSIAVSCMLAVLLPGTSFAQVEGAEAQAPPPAAEAAPVTRDEARPSVAEPAPEAPASPSASSGSSSHPRRRFLGVGTSGGAGLGGQAIIGYPVEATQNRLTLSGTLPTLDVRVFLNSEASIDLSLPLGNMIHYSALGQGFFISLDGFFNFNPRVGQGVRLMLGPGLGASVGSTVQAQTITQSGISVGATAGGVRALLEAGAEFVTEDQVIGIALLGRPWVGLSFLTSPQFQYPYGSYSQSMRTSFSGGILAVVSLTFYAVGRR